MKFVIKYFSESPDLASRISELEDETFPTFLNEEPIWQNNQADIMHTFANYHYLVLDEAGNVVGANINVPLAWSGDPHDLPSYNELLELCLAQHKAGLKPTALVGILGAVAPEYQGKGLAKLLMKTNTQTQRKYGFSYYLSPIRPAIKQLYPNYSLETFLSWRMSEGDLIDSWLNFFRKAGATELGIARDAITMEAPLEQWEQWTGITFPATGQFIIPGGHQMLNVDVSRNTGTYSEDHLWFDITNAF